MVIVAMTAMSLISGFSKRNRNAKINTNASVDDLHRAARSILQAKRGCDTVESKGDGFE